MSLSEYDQTRRDNVIRGLTEYLEWFKSHPDMPADYSLTTSLWMASSLEEFRELRRASGFTNKCSFTDTDRAVDRVFGEIRAVITIPKDKVCKRTKVGTRTIPATPSRVVDVYEWECDDSLLSPSEAPNDQV